MVWIDSKGTFCMMQMFDIELDGDTQITTKAHTSHKDRHILQSLFPDVLSGFMSSPQQCFILSGCISSFGTLCYRCWQDCRGKLCLWLCVCLCVFMHAELNEIHHNIPAVLTNLSILVEWTSATLLSSVIRGNFAHVWRCVVTGCVLQSWLTSFHCCRVTFKLFKSYQKLSWFSPHAYNTPHPCVGQLTTVHP